MRRMKQLVLLVLALFLLLPTTAWAVGVPEVTEEEYRFFLEYYSYQDLDEGFDFADYSNNDLQEIIIENVGGEKNYIDWLKQMLHLFGYGEDYGDEADKIIANTEQQVEIEQASLEQLEQMATFTLVNYSALSYKKMAEDLQYSYQMDVDVEKSTPQEIVALYYKKVMKERFGVKKDLSKYTWYELKDLWDRMAEENTLRDYFGVTEDLSGYTNEEIAILYERYDLIDFIQNNFDVDVDVDKDILTYNSEEIALLWDNLNRIYKRTSSSGVSGNIEIDINNGYVFYPDEENYDNAFYTSDVRPIMQDNRVYIPFRAVFEVLGADVSYNASAKTVTAKRDSTTVSFTVGEAQYSKNGVTQQMDANVFVQDGRTFVPVRFAAQALGATVEWDSENRTVVITE